MASLARHPSYLLGVVPHRLENVRLVRVGKRPARAAASHRNPAPWGVRALRRLRRAGRQFLDSIEQTPADRSALIWTAVHARSLGIGMVFPWR